MRKLNPSEITVEGMNAGEWVSVDGRRYVITDMPMPYLNNVANILRKRIEALDMEQADTSAYHAKLQEIEVAIDRPAIIFDTAEVAAVNQLLMLENHSWSKMHRNDLLVFGTDKGLKDPLAFAIKAQALGIGAKE